uniref:Uncharacterized protein n=2 Tax=Meloidogyne enterolobii TaxID=390850 RepID=A0A6V7W0V3_MELEN|nr:unnamed protein product [Meloidogyne enterolobii]
MPVCSSTAVLITALFLLVLEGNTSFPKGIIAQQLRSSREMGQMNGPLHLKNSQNELFWRIIGLENMCSKEKCHFPSSF